VAIESFLYFVLAKPARIAAAYLNEEPNLSHGRIRQLPSAVLGNRASERALVALALVRLDFANRIGPPVDIIGHAPAIPRGQRRAP
jgi:hypothetical protein